MELYDDYDEFFCRDLIPVSDKLLELATDGNRYHAVFAARMTTAQNARWLIKPEDGFVSPEHEALFVACYSRNSNQGAAFRMGRDSKYASGKVFADIDQDGDLDIVPDCIQPFAGWMLDAYDRSRIVLEDWWLSGRAFRSAWSVQLIVNRVHSLDRKYQYALDTYGATKAKATLKVLQAANPGYVLPDGSAPALGIPGSII